MTEWIKVCYCSISEIILLLVLLEEKKKLDDYHSADVFSSMSALKAVKKTV